jgi:hypothetical protein
MRRLVPFSLSLLILALAPAAAARAELLRMRQVLYGMD